MWAKCGKDGRLPFPAQFSGEVRPTLRPPRRSRRAGNIRYFRDDPFRIATGGNGPASGLASDIWNLLDEARLIGTHLDEGTYDDWYESHVENSTYKPLIDFLRETEE